MRPRYRLLLLTGFVVLFRSAFAEDQCNDVLTNTIMNVSYVSNNSYYNAAVFASLNDQATDTQRDSLGLGVTIDGIPFGLSNEAANTLSSNLSQSYSFQEVRDNQSSVLLMSGQQNILDAWTKCMTQTGGFSLRFDPQDGSNGQKTLLHLEYFNVGGLANTQLPVLQLAQDIVVDKTVASTVSGAECLKRGYRFKPGESCIVNLATTSAWSTMLITANMIGDNGRQSGYSAYLAPRAVMKGAVAAWPSGASPFVVPEIYSVGKGPVVGTPVCATSPTGSIFIAKTINVTPVPRGDDTIRSGSCQFDLVFDPTATRFCATAKLTTFGAISDHYCSLRITADVASVVWNPPKP